MSTGAIDERERSFSLPERRIAELLAQEGRQVRARAASGKSRSADAEVDGTLTEFKTLKRGADAATVKNATKRSIRRAGQARNIIIDARGSGLSEAQAQGGLARVRGGARGKLDHVRLIGDGFDLTLTDFPA